MAKKKSKTAPGKPTGTAGATTSSGAIGAARAAKPRRKAKKKKPASEAAEAPAAATAADAAAPAGDPPSPPAARARSSAAKRQAVLEAILPLTTSARMARRAEEAVWAISSDKTHEMLEAQDKADRALEERAEVEAQRQVATTGAVDPTLRRGSRDAFGFFRAELDRAEEDPRDPHARWRATRERLRHEVLPGATPERLAEVEERLGVQLPRSYYDFCLEWNGAHLYTSEAGGYRVLSATGIVDEVKGALCNRMVRPYLPVVDLGCGDYLALDTERPGKGGEYPLVWWYGGEAKRRVAESFSQWLKRLIEGAGHPYWWDPPS